MVVDPSFVVIVGLLGAVAFAADRLGFPSVPAYILVGLVLGPVWALAAPYAGLPVLNISGEPLSLMSELGLLFLLFIVGLQVRLDDVSRFFPGAAYMSLVQAAGIILVSSTYLWYSGFSPVEIAVFGSALIPSSAAIVVPMLKRNNELSSQNGALDVSVLVVESVFLVVAIGLVTAISDGSAAGVLKVLGAVFGGLAAAVASSRFVLPRMLAEVSEDRKSFLVLGLGVLGAFVIFSSFAGLRPEIGAFFAGVALAQLPYSEELQAAVDPMTDFFLAIFLAGLGLGLSPSKISSVLVDATVLSLLVVPTKSCFYYLGSYALDVSRYSSLRSSMDLSQVPDISIVFAGAAASAGLIGSSSVALITLVVILTMSVSSILITLGDRVASRFFSKPSYQEESPDAVLAGFGSAGRAVVDVLNSFYESVVVVDRSPESSGSVSPDSLFYGDLSHEETRERAGLGSAETIVSLETDLDIKEEIIEEYSDKKLILAEESSRVSLQLLESGADYVINRKIITANELIDRVNHD